MAGKTEDRRVRRTRLLLVQAAQDLILERGYAATSVQDILDRADVGRSTFYAHFRDKDDLLVSGFDIFHAEMVEALSEPGRSGPPDVSDIILELFEHAQRNRRAFRAMMGDASGEIVVRVARERLQGHFRQETQALLPASKQPQLLEALVEYQVNALLSLLQWWLDSESTLSPAEMHQLYLTLTVPGLKAVAA
jgi:AcrR family transcriptional regulator